jgi:hypothetical protein
MTPLLLWLVALACAAELPFVRGPFQVERSFALLFAAPVSAEISAVARVMNLQLNVTCHGTYAGSDVDDIEFLLQTPLTKLDQAYKFSGIDVRAAGLRHKRQQKAKLFATDSAKAQQVHWVVGFAQHVQHVWRSLARLCEPFHMRVVAVRRRDRVAHALALAHEKLRARADFNATTTMQQVSVQFEDFVDAFDTVQRDNALLDWFLSTFAAHSCVLEIDLETLASSPDASIGRLLTHFGANPAQRLDDAATNASVALRGAIRSRGELASETSNAIALLRRIRRELAV